jgi:hypothetical protein
MALTIQRRQTRLRAENGFLHDHPVRLDHIGVAFIVYNISDNEERYSDVSGLE